MHVLILAIEMDSLALPAFVLSLLGVLLGLYALRKKPPGPPPARVRPFHHFKLVNESDEPIDVAHVSGWGDPNGGGDQKMPNVDLAPPSMDPVGGNRYFEYPLPDVGPDYVKSLKLHVMVKGDTVERDLSPIQVPPSPNAAAGDYKYLYASEVTLKKVTAAASVGGGYDYEFEVKSFYWFSAGMVKQLLSTYKIPPPPPP